MGKTKQGQWKWTLNLIGLSLITFLIEYVSRLSGIDLFLLFHLWISAATHHLSPWNQFKPVHFFLRVSSQHRDAPAHAPGYLPRLIMTDCLWLADFSLLLFMWALCRWHPVRVRQHCGKEAPLSYTVPSAEAEPPHDGCGAASAHLTGVCLCQVLLYLPFC